MSIIHLDDLALSNTIACLVSQDNTRQDLAEFFAEVSGVNTWAYNGRYSENVTRHSAEHLLSITSYSGGFINIAVSTLASIEANCDGLLGGDAMAKIGRFALSLARELVRRNALMAQREAELIKRSGERLGEIDALKAEIKSMKKRPARKSGR